MADANSKVRILAPAEGETLNVMGAQVRVKLGGDPRFLFLADHPVPPGYHVPTHNRTHTSARRNRRTSRSSA